MIVDESSIAIGTYDVSFRLSWPLLPLKLANGGLPQPMAGEPGASLSTVGADTPQANQASDGQATLVLHPFAAAGPMSAACSASSSILCPAMGVRCGRASALGPRTARCAAGQRHLPRPSRRADSGSAIDGLAVGRNTEPAQSAGLAVPISPVARSRTRMPVGVIAQTTTNRSLLQTATVPTVSCRVLTLPTVRPISHCP